MALRVKNIQQGFVDATGFHPIRSSSDYDTKRSGEVKKKRKAATKKRKAKSTTATKRRKATSRPATKRAKKTKYQTAAYKRRVSVKRAPARRKRNPGLLDRIHIIAHRSDGTSFRPSKHAQFAYVGDVEKQLKAEGYSVRREKLGEGTYELHVTKPSKAKKLKNPIPTSRWVTAKVKRTASGDVKIMIPGATVRR